MFNKLQLIQNAAARVLTRTKNIDHITLTIGSAPSYFTDMLTESIPVRSLRSSVKGLHTIGNSKLYLPMVLSVIMLPLSEVLYHLSRGLFSFKSSLKTYLFLQAYFSIWFPFIVIPSYFNCFDWLYFSIHLLLCVYVNVFISDQFFIFLLLFLLIFYFILYFCFNCICVICFYMYVFCNYVHWWFYVSAFIFSSVHIYILLTQTST